MSLNNKTKDRDVLCRCIFVAFVVGLFAFFIWLSFAISEYSPVDEALHFDYINHIVKNNALPTFNDSIDYDFLNRANGGGPGSHTNYEVVQAPFFYLVFAIIGKFMSDPFVRFHTFRLLSLALVLVVYLFVDKTVKLLKENGYEIDQNMYRLLLLLTIFNPGYLYRASRISNEILVCVLCAALMYVVLKCILSGYRKRYYWEISLLCVACFMTKSTAVYVYAVFVMVALLQRKIKEAVLPFVSGLILTVPWFIFNYRTYGHLTAMKEHLDCVLPMINEEGKIPSLYGAFAHNLLGTFYTGEEVRFANADNIFVFGLFILIAFLLFRVIQLAVGDVKEKEWRINDGSKEAVISIVCITFVVACLVVLALGTVATRIVCLRARYFYGVSIALIFPILIYRDKLFDRYFKTFFYIIGIIVVGIATYRNVSQSVREFLIR